MKLSKISQKLSASIAGSLVALVFVGSCDLPKTKRPIEPVGWADVNSDFVKDAIIKKIIYKTKYGERLVAVDGRNIKKEKEQWVTNDSWNIPIGAFGPFENLEGLMITPKRQKWGKYKSYVPLHARILASEDGGFGDISVKDDGLRIFADISTTSSYSPSMPNRYRLSDIRSLGYKTNDFGDVRKLK